MRSRRSRALVAARFLDAGIAVRIDRPAADGIKHEARQSWAAAPGSGVVIGNQRAPTLAGGELRTRELARE
jgi:hypothetical protein